MRPQPARAHSLGRYGQYLPMRKLIFIAYLLIPFISQSQIDYINQQELYVKNDIKIIQRDSHFNGIVEKEEIWKLDSLGRIVFQEFMPDSWIPIHGRTFWNYNENLLLSEIEIATWTNREKQDTATTLYYYNDFHLLIKTQYTNTRNNDTLIILNNYNQNFLIGDSIFHSDYNSEYSTYSYELSDSNNIKKETKTVYRKFDEIFYLDYKIEKEFDNLGNLLKESMFGLSQDDLDYLDTAYVYLFTYENGKLIKIDEEYFSEDPEEPNEKYVIIFEYNDQGLVSKFLEMDEKGEEYYETYTYK